MTRLIEELRPAVVLAGHMHFEYTARLGATRIFGMGYGVRGRYALLRPDLSFTFADLEGGPVVPRAALPRNQPVAVSGEEIERQRRERAELSEEDAWMLAEEWLLEEGFIDGAPAG